MARSREKLQPTTMTFGVSNKPPIFRRYCLIPLSHRLRPAGSAGRNYPLFRSMWIRPADRDAALRGSGSVDIRRGWSDAVIRLRSVGFVYSMSRAGSYPQEYQKPGIAVPVGL